MTAELLQAISQAGGRVTAAGGDLALEAAQPLTDELLALIKEHKPELLAALQAGDLREHFEERAGILEYDAGLPRVDAELEAARITATYTRNAGYQWTALRMAFRDCPALLASLPDKAGTRHASAWRGQGRGAG